MPENINLHKDILLYHVVPANARSTSLSNDDIDTLNGDPVEVAISGADVSVNDASVIVPDIIASNGIIHVIDSVFLPPADVEAVVKPVATHMPTRKPNNKPTPTSGKAFKSKTSKGSKSNKSAKMTKRGIVQGIYFGRQTKCYCKVRESARCSGCNTFMRSNLEKFVVSFCIMVISDCLCSKCS